MRVDGRELTQQLTVQRHPRFTSITDADLREQFALGIQIRDKVSEANESVIQIPEIKRDAAARMEQNNSARLRQLGNTLTTNLSDVEDDIYQVRNQSGQDPLNFPIRINNRLANLLRIINSGDGKPIGNLPVLFREYSAQLDAQTARLQQVLARDLAAFNAELRRLGLPVITPQCLPGRACNVIL